MVLGESETGHSCRVMFSQVAEALARSDVGKRSLSITQGPALIRCLGWNLD